MSTAGTAVFNLVGQCWEYWNILEPWFSCLKYPEQIWSWQLHTSIRSNGLEMLVIFTAVSLSSPAHSIASPCSPRPIPQTPTTAKAETGPTWPPSKCTRQDPVDPPNSLRDGHLQVYSQIVGWLVLWEQKNVRNVLLRGFTACYSVFTWVQLVSWLPRVGSTDRQNPPPWSVETFIPAPALSSTAGTALGHKCSCNASTCVERGLYKRFKVRSSNIQRRTVDFEWSQLWCGSGVMGQDIMAANDSSKPPLRAPSTGMPRQRQKQRRQPWSEYWTGTDSSSCKDLREIYQDQRLRLIYLYHTYLLYPCDFASADTSSFLPEVVGARFQYHTPGPFLTSPWIPKLLPLWSTSPTRDIVQHCGNCETTNVRQSPSSLRMPPEDVPLGSRPATKPLRTYDVTKTYEIEPQTPQRWESLVSASMSPSQEAYKIRMQLLLYHCSLMCKWH